MYPGYDPHYDPHYHPRPSGYPPRGRGDYGRRGRGRDGGMRGGGFPRNMSLVLNAPATGFDPSYARPPPPGPAPPYHFPQPHSAPRPRGMSWSSPMSADAPSYLPAQEGGRGWSGGRGDMGRRGVPWGMEGRRGRGGGRGRHMVLVNKSLPYRPIAPIVITPTQPSAQPFEHMPQLRYSGGSKPSVGEKKPVARYSGKAPPVRRLRILQRRVFAPGTNKWQPEGSSSTTPQASSGRASSGAPKIGYSASHSSPLARFYRLSAGTGGQLARYRLMLIRKQGAAVRRNRAKIAAIVAAKKRRKVYRVRRKGAYAANDDTAYSQSYVSSSSTSSGTSILTQYRRSHKGLSLVRKHTTLVLRPPPSEPPSDAKPLQPPSSPVKPILKGPSILRRRRLERARALVSQAVGHSRHRTLLRAKAKKDKKVEFCLFFNRFGKCNKADTCPYIHDKDKVAVCRKFLKGKCNDEACLLSHVVAREKMPVCEFFLRGACNNDDCPYSHVKVNPKAGICPDFQKGYCPQGDACKLKHILEPTASTPGSGKRPTTSDEGEGAKRRRVVLRKGAVGGGGAGVTSRGEGGADASLWGAGRRNGSGVVSSTDRCERTDEDKEEEARIEAQVRQLLMSAMLMGARAPYAPPPPPIPRPPRSDDGTYASMISGSASSLSVSVDASSLVSASSTPDPRPLRVEAPVVVRPHVAQPPVIKPPVIKPPVIKPPPVMEDRTAMLLMKKVEERMPRPEVVESAKKVVEEEDDDDDMLPRVLRGVAR